MRTLLCSVALAAALAAKDPRELPATDRAALGAPVMGYVFDAAAGALRPLRGLPGAAVLAAPLDLGLPLSSAAVSSIGTALGVAADDGRVLLVYPGAALATPLPDARPAPDRIVFSPAGRAAALYYQDTAQLALLAGLPDKPALAGTIDLSLCPGALTALAVSDDAAVAAAFSENGAASLFAATAGAAPRLLYTAQHISSIAFQDGTRDALFADDAANRVWLAQDVTGSDAVRLLAGPDDGIAAPAAVAWSSDGARAFIANAGSLTTVSLADGLAAATACACSPSRLDRLDGGRLLRLSEPAPGTPVWLLDTATGALLFVPALSAQAVAQ